MRPTDLSDAAHTGMALQEVFRHPRQANLFQHLPLPVMHGENLATLRQRLPARAAAKAAKLTSYMRKNIDFAGHADEVSG